MVSRNLSGGARSAGLECVDDFWLPTTSSIAGGPHHGLCADFHHYVKLEMTLKTIGEEGSTRHSSSSVNLKAIS